MTNKEVKKLEDRLSSATSWWPYAEKYFNILSNKIEYTNDDVNELIEYYTKKERYENCIRLTKLIK